MADLNFTALTPELHAYVVEHGVRDDAVLHRVQRDTEAMGGISIMQVSPDQGAFLTLLSRAIGARRILEVGTFTGYSAICLARGLPDDGSLLCCELDPGYAAIARSNLDDAGVGGRVEIRVGPALDTLRSLPADPLFDLAFIDADKPTYADYYEEALARLRPGGLIALDNTLLSGLVVEPPADHASARALHDLNARLAHDARVDIALLTVSDGMTLARKR
jgi:caffeoyl-CoA O-methyltransferase